MTRPSYTERLFHWLAEGEKQGFCSQGVCSTHDLLSLTAEEAAEFEEGGDPCVPAVRIWIEPQPEVP